MEHTAFQCFSLGAGHAGYIRADGSRAAGPDAVFGGPCGPLLNAFHHALLHSLRCSAQVFVVVGQTVRIPHPHAGQLHQAAHLRAAQLVLQAGGLAKGGSIYVLDMGEPVKIMDLANRLIRFYGYEPGVNMQVKVTGLRPGEKLYEELLMDSEQDKMAKTAHNKIFIAPPMQIDLEKFYTDLQRLKDSARHNSDEVVDVLQEMVPTYHPNRRVRADHTVVAATGNTALFSREEIAQKLRETEHPAEEG
mgnify:FL=1